VAQFGVVNTDRLNLRDMPSTSGKVIQVLLRNAALDVLKAMDAEWLQVQIAGTTISGYAAKAYVQVSAAPATPPTSATPGKQGEVTTTTLNVRSGAGVEKSILFTLVQGAKITVLEQLGDWLRITVSNQTGFVSAQYVKVTDAPAPKKDPVTPVTPVAPVNSLAGFLIDNADLLASTLKPDLQIPAQTPGTDQALIANTWNNFGGLVGDLAKLLNIPPGTAIATLSAESGGRVSGPDGRMIIRFEVHVFWRYWGSSNVDAFNRFFIFDRSFAANAWKGHQWRSDPAQAFQDFHGDQGREWQAFSFARTLNEEAALSSISMGAGQVMGFNFKRLGYATVQAMFQSLSSSPQAQLIGIFDFVKGEAANSPAIQALQRNDFLTFATIYNGSGNAQTYSGIIQRYVNIFNQLMATARKPGAF